MKNKILFAGGTGNLGELIVKALIKRGADVRVITRPESDPEKTEKLRQLGAEVITVEMSDTEELKNACQDVSCVVSALSGLRETIVDAQIQLLDAAIAAGVPCFIPSDFAGDFTRLPEGYNRNFDLRKEFHQTLDNSPIASTSIMNGAFSYVLNYGTPIYGVKNHSVGYWGNDPDWKIDFSTMENTADYTAAAALDSETLRVLRIASFQVSPKDLAAIGKEVKKQEFKLIPMGSLEDFVSPTKKTGRRIPKAKRKYFPNGRQNSICTVCSAFTTKRLITTCGYRKFDLTRQDSSLIWTSMFSAIGAAPVLCVPKTQSEVPAQLF